MSNRADIDALVAAGKHAEAAEAALAAGEPTRAADLYEKLWQFAAAARAARAAGDTSRALRLALEARDQPLIDELHAQLTGTDDGTRIVIDLYARARRHGDAAMLAEKLGELDRAIDFYQRGHRDLDAARLLEASGRDREAGRLLEKLVDLSTGDERLESRLRLGRILARRAAYADAARHLQEVRNHGAAPARKEALRHLVAVLAAMGLRDGARDVLLDLRRLDPEIPVDLDVYLRSWRDAAPKTDRSRDLLAGRYRLEKLLGAGGAGRVFLALDEVSGRTVAVKVMHAADARGSAAYERFLREARVALALRHPSLVEVYEVSVEHGLLVMEYMSGGSLAQRLAAGEPMPGALVKRMALELIAGLEMAHHRGVVHRDIKPANVFFDARGTAKLGDFGVAHLLDLGQTQTGGLIGTLAYMSPEQITGAPLTITADLYSLGITLFEAVTGRLPFLGPDFVAQHLGESPPAPSETRPEVGPGWDPLLLGLLAKNPDDRTASITALRTQLEALDMGGRPLVLPIPDRKDSQRHSIADLAADDAAASAPRQRYQFETQLGQTAISRLYRAVDTNLDRTVVIERFDDGETADLALARVKKLGGVSSPFVQRALSLDRPTRTAVFEAPAGGPFGELLRTELAPTDLVRLLKRLARAVASLHEVGVAHGGITASTVVVDDAAVPTLMIAGLGQPPADATPARDVTAVIALAANLFECAPTIGQLAAAMMPDVRPLALAEPTDGEALYGAVDALEVALVRALAS